MNDRDKNDSVSLKLLPLGTVFRLKDGGANDFYMVTGYFVESADKSKAFDYTITPWPVGFKLKPSKTPMTSGERAERFYGTDDGNVGDVLFMGAVSSELASWQDGLIDEVAGRNGLRPPAAQGASFVAGSLGDLPCSMGGDRPGKHGALSLGSVVSERKHPGRKTMIIALSGKTEPTGKRHDYCVCAWPEGADPGDKYMYPIKHSDIVTVHFRGYESRQSKRLARISKLKRISRSIPFNVLLWLVAILIAAAIYLH